MRSPDAPPDHALAGTQQPGFFDGRQDDRPMRSHVTAPDPAGLQVQVSLVLDPDEGGVAWPGLAMVGLMLLSLAAVGALAVALVMRALRPVAAAEAALRARAPQQLDPIPLDGLPDEMRPLIDAFNDHLGRTAERLSRERGFTALAAHELRTPLSALRMQVQVALRLPDGPARQAQLQSVLASVDRSDHLIHQLLTLARVEQGRGTTSLPVDLRALATGVAEDLSLQERQRGVTVAVVGRPVSVLGWSFALSVMLRNLIDNAIAHAPAGSSVRVAVGQGVGGVELCVDDAGPGIPEADRPRSFQRFMRLNDGALRPGVGLGLSIAQAVADAHGARIELQDAPVLGGLRVRVLFPTEAGPVGSLAPAP
jgi:signal transduction histidine kinase